MGAEASATRTRAKLEGPPLDGKRNSTLGSKSIDKVDKESVNSHYTRKRVKRCARASVIVLEKLSRDRGFLRRAT